jgi:membrane-bound lytic murein transglycosylase D
MHQILGLLTVLFFSINTLMAQAKKPKPVVKDSASSEAFLKMIESSLDAFYADYANQSNFDSIINELEYEPKSIPDFSDDEICARLARMNEISTFHLDCNPSTISVIRYFAKNRRSFIRIALGRSRLYFDRYEEALDKHGMPIDLKFLSVIESGLRPQVKSPAGALGLWQFMYGTGKMFGMQENAYYDERMDPAKSTDAACRYLNKLHGIYGDWNLALAAYNAGPGNINKAIRRSGGKTTYWEIRPFLPRETQGYVPNFIAAAYLMTYHADYNLAPMEAKIHYAHLDTMCLKNGVHMETISQLISWDVEEIQSLNPVFKKTYIPLSSPIQCISGPLMKIGKLVSLEDSLYKLERQLYGGGNVRIENPSNSAKEEIDNNDLDNVSTKYIFHKVRKGETLTRIAQKYGVSTTEIMNWNGLRSTKVPYGKVLKIEQTISEPNKASAKDSVMGLVFYDSLITVYHLVKRNESIEVIAQKFNVTVDNIKTWNNLNDNLLSINQKLLIITSLKFSRAGMVINLNKVDEVVVKDEVKKPVEKIVSTQKKYYTIRSGDLFNRIAQKHGLSSAELKKLNPGVNPDRISVGQKMRVK